MYYRLILRIQHLIIDQISVGKELSSTARVREFVIPQINGAPPLHGNTCFMQLVVYNFCCILFTSPHRRTGLLRQYCYCT